MTTNHRYVICYPGGAGGSFITTALNSVRCNTKFIVDRTLGHCHFNSSRIANFFHGDTLRSFQEELLSIESFDFAKNLISFGHCRNIVALKETISTQLGHNEIEKTKFIKISVDPNNSKEILFVASMLRKKVNCFPELSFNEYLIQTTDYIKSWYWIENAYTMSHTITLTLSDIFLNRVSSKLNLSQEESNRIDQCQVEYLNVQKQLHSDLIQLLHE